MTDKPNNWQYACENFEAVQAALAGRDLVATLNQVYRGAGVAGLFQTPDDVAQMRVGRRHFEGHEDYKFNEGSRSGMPFAEMCHYDYSVFIPLIAENVDAIREGRPFQYAVAEYVQVDDEGFITSLDPQKLQRYTGGLSDLVALIPKKKISGVSSTDVRIGSSVTEGVKSSNVDDVGDVLIYSLSGMSSVMYNPTQADVPRPHFHWGSNGWKKPLEVMVKGDQLFFDERQQPEGKLWLLKFQKEGYDPMQL